MDKVTYTLISLLILFPAQLGAQVIYETDFDDLTLGVTENPANSGQDGWTSIFHPGASFGEIQDQVSNGGRAIRQFTDITNTNAQQSIDNRSFSSVNTASISEILFDIDFHASSSDISTRNSYGAQATIDGDGQVFGFSVDSGNGQVRSDVGVSVGLSTFNGIDNNFRIGLSVGQNLAWDQWHELELRADLITDEWISITVNGQTQSLAGIDLPRNFPGGIPATASFLDRVTLQVVNSENFGEETSDSIFFDNLSLQVTAVPEPNASLYLTLILTVVVSQRKRRADAG